MLSYIMSNKYEEEKVYTIRCKLNPEYVYVGSTYKSLEERWKAHKYCSKEKLHCNRLIYRTINDKWDDWYIELYMNYPCTSKKELIKFEGEIIKQIGNLKSNISGRTMYEWMRDNREQYLNKSREYYLLNADVIKEKRREYYHSKDKIKFKNDEVLKEYQSSAGTRAALGRRRPAWTTPLLHIGASLRRRRARPLPRSPGRGRALNPKPQTLNPKP